MRLPKNEDKKADQIGSAIIRSKGIEPAQGDMHKKTGLEVYHGMRITDFGDDNAFNAGENKYNANTLTANHQSSNFNHNKLDKTYELSYVRDSDGTKYQKTLAHNIYLHSIQLHQLAIK